MVPKLSQANAARAKADRYAQAGDYATAARCYRSAGRMYAALLLPIQVADARYLAKLCEDVIGAKLRLLAEIAASEVPAG